MARTLSEAIDALVEAAEERGYERGLSSASDEIRWAQSEEDAIRALHAVRAEVDALVAASRAGQGEGQ